MKNLMMIMKMPFVVMILSFVLFGCTKSKTGGDGAQGARDGLKGGVFYASLSAEPTTLNPFSSSGAYAAAIHERTMDRLMVRNYETYGWDPALAEKADKAADGMSFTFYLRKNAKFHDGKPVTAEDVKFTFDAIRNPEYKAFSLAPYLENIDRAEVIDPHTVKFFVKKKYFNNFNVLAGIDIAPKHVYGDPKKKLNKILVGSGPYKLKKYDKGRSIVLERNKDWWGVDVAHLKTTHNPDQFFYRFIKEDNVSLEMLKKGKIDYLNLTAEQFLKKTDGKIWDDRVTKHKVTNDGPQGYGFVGWNLKNRLFESRDVRVALAHLMNRDLMNKKFRYDMSLLATGPWYQKSPYASKSVKPFEFNPEGAAKLLAKAGWKDTDKDGVLDKTVGGKKVNFKFTLLFPNRDSEKYFTIYREDLKKAGIVMDLKIVEWNSFIKALDERKFEAVALGWGAGSVDNDPKQIWHSDSIKGTGSNFISYSNKEVDQLIEKGRSEIDRQKRIKIYQQIYEKIAYDAPYAFMFNNKYGLYAVSKRVGMEKPTYRYNIGGRYWWLTAE